MPPFCPPTRCWPDGRKDFGIGLRKPPLVGGLLEFLLLKVSRASRPSIRSCIAATCAVRSLTRCTKGHSSRIRSSLRVAELREVGQAMHHSYFGLRLQRKLSSYKIHAVAHRAHGGGLVANGAGATTENP